MDKIILHKKIKAVMPRVIRTPRQIFRLLSLITLCTVLNISVAHAIETTKASGLVIEKGQTLNSSLSSSSQNSCHQYLSVNYVPPKHNINAGMNDNAAVPAALGLVFAVRLVLGPKEIVPSSKRIQIGPEIRGSNDKGNSYALAIAAYRNCQKQEFLKSR